MKTLKFKGAVERIKESNKVVRSFKSAVEKNKIEQKLELVIENKTSLEPATSSDSDEV